MQNQRLGLVLVKFAGAPLEIGERDALRAEDVALGVVLGADHFAVLERRERKSARRAQQADLVARGLLPELAERLLLALVELGVDLSEARAVFVALERRRNRQAQFLHQLLHVVLQLLASSRRQRQRQRLVRLREIVDVGPVERSGAGGLFAFEVLPHQRALARPGRPHHEQVVTLARDVDAEFHGIARALLA